MQLKFVASDLVETEGIQSFLAAHHTATWRDRQGQPHESSVDWSEPQLRSGLWESVVEWIGRINLAAVPASVAAGLLTNYLWSLIHHGRSGPTTETREAPAPKPTTAPPFQGLSKLTIVIVRDDRRIQFDPLRVDHSELELLVASLFDGKDAADVQDHAAG
jgi:hypothetical protein